MGVELDDIAGFGRGDRRSGMVAEEIESRADIDADALSAMAINAFALNVMVFAGALSVTAATAAARLGDGRAQAPDRRDREEDPDADDLLEVVRGDRDESEPAVRHGFDGAFGHERHHRLADGAERHAELLGQTRRRIDAILGQLPGDDGITDDRQGVLPQGHRLRPGVIHGVPPPLRRRLRADSTHTG